MTRWLFWLRPEEAAALVFLLPTTYLTVVANVYAQRTGALGALILLDGAATLGAIWAVGRIGLTLASPAGGTEQAWFWLGLIGVLQLLRPLLNVAGRWLGVGIGHSLERTVRERVMAAAGAPLGIAHLETPAGAALFATAGIALIVASPYMLLAGKISYSRIVGDRIRYTRDDLLTYLRQRRQEVRSDNLPAKRYR